VKLFLYIYCRKGVLERKKAARFIFNAFGGEKKERRKVLPPSGKGGKEKGFLGNAEKKKKSALFSRYFREGRKKEKRCSFSNPR